LRALDRGDAVTVRGRLAGCDIGWARGTHAVPRADFGNMSLKLVDCVIEVKHASANDLPPLFP
jgi:hypothetical protein